MQTIDKYKNTKYIGFYIYLLVYVQVHGPTNCYSLFQFFRAVAMAHSLKVIVKFTLEQSRGSRGIAVLFL